MKSIKEKIIQNQLKECELINKENKNISIYVKTIQDKKEYLLLKKY